MAKATIKLNERNPFIWKHIHFLGSLLLNWDNPIIYRFTSYSLLKEIFKKKQIVFLSPKKWEDPFETRYLDADAIENGKRVVLPYIACLCFKMSKNDNSAAFWDAAKTDGDFFVRISFDLFQLCSALEKFAGRTNARIYVCAANYNYSVDDLKNAHTNESIMKGSLEESYVRLMSLKRKAYKYENELRIFVVWDSENKHKEFEKYKNEGLIRISCSPKQIIKKIMLESEMFSKEHVAIDLGLYDKLTKKDFQENEKEIVKNIEGVNIVHSSFRIKRRKQKISFPL